MGSRIHSSKKIIYSSNSTQNGLCSTDLAPAGGQKGSNRTTALQTYYSTKTNNEGNYRMLSNHPNPSTRSGDCTAPTTATTKEQNPKIHYENANTTLKPSNTNMASPCSEKHN